MAKGSLKDFVALVKTNGVAKPSHFSVMFTPVGKPILSNFNIESMLLYCSQANIPGINIASNPAKIFGETFEFAYEKMYGPLNLSFYVDTNMEVKKIFDSWMDNIQDPKTKRFSYYSDFTTDITLNVYDTMHKKVYTMTFYEAYPKSIGDIQLDYGAQGFMSMPVTFTYRYFETFSSQGIDDVPLANTDEGGLFSAGSKIIKDYVDDFKEFQANAFEEIGKAKDKVYKTAKSAISGILKK